MRGALLAEQVRIDEAGDVVDGDSPVPRVVRLHRDDGGVAVAQQVDARAPHRERRVHAQLLRPLAVAVVKATTVIVETPRD